MDMILILVAFFLGFLILNSERFFPFAKKILHSHYRKKASELEVKNKKYLAALQIYENKENWIGCEFVGTEDPTAPARTALKGGNVEEIKFLPASKFALKSDE